VQVAHAIIPIAGLIFLGGALPTRWAWRIWLVTGIIGGTLVLLAPNARWEDQGFLYGVAERAFMAAMLITLIGAVLRWVLARFVWPSLRAPSQLSSDAAESLRATDQVTACVLGICAGLFLSLFAALTLRGATGGLTLHLFVSGVAALAAVWVFRNVVGHARLAGGTALTIVAAVAILGGTVWPPMIRAQADGIMPGLPRCLRALERPAAEGEIMLLTLPQGRRGSPGLILTIMAADGAQHFRWSYRANQFVRYEAYRFGDCPSRDIE
jgi:hypothetical protein